MSQIVDSFPEAAPRKSKYDKFMGGDIHRIVPAHEMRKTAKAAEQALRQFCNRKNRQPKIRHTVEKDEASGRPIRVLYFQDQGPKVQKQSIPADVVTDRYLTEA